MVNGILWSLRTGAPWRDLPERYGTWQTVSGRFYRWRKQGIWQRLFVSLQQQAQIAGKINWEIHVVDGSVVRAHQHAAGAIRGSNEITQTSLPYQLYLRGDNLLAEGKRRGL